MSYLGESLIFLLAAVIFVPLSRRLGFGAILGYLAGGIIIGPYGLALITDVDHILHFAELGVVFLLFGIGLELKPSRLWIMRRMVFGLGLSQVLLSAIAIAAIAWAVGIPERAAVVLGLVLALSSTAFVLQMLAEKKQLSTTHGRAAFSILLFQDLAVIPLIAILPLLGANASFDAGVDVLQIALMVGVIVGLIAAGHFLLGPVLRIAASSGIPEILTAMALLVVIGSALLMQAVGMSMVLGAFIAGVMLADSEYRHQLEVDIGPFKGLLLGLFFIAVGMNVHIELLLEIPGRILVIVALLMATKALVLYPLARRFSPCDTRDSLKLAALLSQGGEFAFVLFAIAAAEQALPTPLIDEMILAVAVSMMLTPFFYMLAERRDRKEPREETAISHDVQDDGHDVIIAGNGRVGQIIGRMLSASGKRFTALERDASKVDLLRRYGAKVYYGDASSLDVLRAAGAERATVFVLAISNLEDSMVIAEMVTKHFPNVTVIARARNRRHAHRLMDLGITAIFRETFNASIAMSEEVLTKLGRSRDEAKRTAEAFSEHDAQLLLDQHGIHDSEEMLIQSSQDTKEELEELLRAERDG